jgi:hypothetical protein
MGGLQFEQILSTVSRNDENNMALDRYGQAQLFCVLSFFKVCIVFE